MGLFLEIILYFFIYAFLGWFCECIYCFIGNNKIVIELRKVNIKKEKIEISKIL